MNQPLICHFLIGNPASGKSTFAKDLVRLFPNSVIVSTDAIRTQLYGDESIQGDWKIVEEEVLKQIQRAVNTGKSVIYDATNAKRLWRMDLLIKLAPLNVRWIGWLVNTPLAICQQRNQQRSRQVPETVLKDLATSLKQFPPLAAEGFTVVDLVPFKNNLLDSKSVLKKIEGINKRLNYRQNRIHNFAYHQYSRLLDFDRLMHLISLIICYPSLGELYIKQRDILEQIFGTVPDFTNSLQEICAVIGKLRGSIYANPQAIKADLEWLEINGILAQGEVDAELQIERLDSPELVTHPYSDLDTFERLIKIIRFIIHHPFLHDSNLGTQATFIEEMNKKGVITYDFLDSLQKDIEKVLKPYKILDNVAYTRGYFAGTAILSAHELEKVFRLLQSRSIHFDDPVAVEIHQAFIERLKFSNLVDTSQVYPVRVIGTKSIVDTHKLPARTLSKNLESLEKAIENGELLQLNRLRGVAKFTGDQEEYFQAYPLQLVFHNIAWYLGYETVGGEYNKLLRFERIDRLALGESTRQFRERKQQQQVLVKLTKLYNASAGIFLGDKAEDQQQFLSSKKSERQAVTITVELWFNNYIFRFISEGTQRFPISQMKMSLPQDKSQHSLDKDLFCLTRTNDTNFPNRLQVNLPIWSLDDVDLKRWILGFAGEVKVVAPQELMLRIKAGGEAIAFNYNNP